MKLAKKQQQKKTVHKIISPAVKRWDILIFLAA